jgi:heterodisulfide reductase subunit A
MAEIESPRVGVFVCHCGSNIAGVVDVEQVVDFAKTLPGVVFAADQMFSCAGNTQKEIEEAIQRENINRVVVAACSPKTHESIFKGVLIRVGLNPYLLEMSNIRNMDSWVHKFDKEAATSKAMDMVSMAVEKAQRLQPLEISHLPLAQSALVIGGGIAGMTAASALARQGFETHLLEKNAHLGGQVDLLNLIAPAGIKASDLLVSRSLDLIQSGVHLHLCTTVETIGGVVGDFRVQLSNGEKLQVGAIVVATGAEAYRPVEFGYGDDPAVITNLDLETLIAHDDVSAERITFISCVGARQGNIGCARYCCTSMISQALQLRKMGKMVRIVSKDGQDGEDRQQRHPHLQPPGRGVV